MRCRYPSRKEPEFTHGCLSAIADFGLFLRIGYSARSPAGALCLKTMAAKDWPPLGGQEWNCRLGAALGASGARLGTNISCPGGPFSLARLTALGVVPELLLLEEQLFAGGKHKLTAAIDALQDLIGKLHLRVLPSLGPKSRDRCPALPCNADAG